MFHATRRTFKIEVEYSLFRTHLSTNKEIFLKGLLIEQPPFCRQRITVAWKKRGQWHYRGACNKGNELLSLLDPIDLFGRLVKALAYSPRDDEFDLVKL